MKTNFIRLLAVVGLLAASVSVNALPVTVQVAWEGATSTPLLDARGSILYGGTVTGGTGALIELGYYSQATLENPFAGQFITLIGEDSAYPSVKRSSTVNGGVLKGSFSASSSFLCGTDAAQKLLPKAGTPLAIRIFDKPTAADSQYYNVVSGGENWRWKDPTDAPGAFVCVSLEDANLRWLGTSSRTSVRWSATGAPVLGAPVSALPARSAAQNASSAPAPVSALVGGMLKISAPVRTSPATYTAKNLPPGLKLDAKTGLLSGVPTTAGSYKVSVTPVNKSGVVETPVVVDVRVATLNQRLSGVFNGVVERSQALNGKLGAALQLNVSAAGSYSGKMLVGGSVCVITGTLEADKADATRAVLSAPVACLGSGGRLYAQLDGETQCLNGTVTNGVAVAAVSGSQSPWTAASPATSFGGTYAFRLGPDVSVSSSTPAPKGFGYGTLTVAPASGVALISATLADGTRLSLNSTLGAIGDVPVYGPFKEGSVLGTLLLNLGASAPAKNTVSGDVSWFKAAVSGAANYAGGFGPLALDVAGGINRPTQKGEMLMGLSGPTAGAPWNASFSFSGGGLDTERLEFKRPASVSPLGNDLSNLASLVRIEGSAPTVSLSAMDPATGAFGGTFLLSGKTSVTDRRVSFSGQIVTTGTLTRGYGFFMMPALSGSGTAVDTKTSRSGAVLFSRP